jgi:hypothetical protein
MRLVYGLTFAVAAALVVPSALSAQQPQEGNRKVAGGIMIPGWQGQIDDSKENAGSKLEDAKLEMVGSVMKVTTGPALVYWNPKNVAAGNYTVKATFNEPQFQNVNTHPHPYGIFIGGNDLGTPNRTLLYCSAYGDGRFITRIFGPAVVNLNGRGEANAAINKAAGVGQPVKQDIAVAVTADKVTCSINGTVVGTYNKADIVGAGKLKSTDGVYGIRFAHNTDGTVTGLSMSKN